MGAAVVNREKFEPFARGRSVLLTHSQIGNRTKASTWKCDYTYVLPVKDMYTVIQRDETHLLIVQMGET
jgi:hypothetical protein